MARRLLKDTCETARAIMAGELDSDLGWIAQACKARLKRMYVKGAQVRLVGTKNPEFEGKVGTIMKLNTKTVSVGVGEKDDYGFYAHELNVPTHMLAPVS